MSTLGTAIRSWFLNPGLYGIVLLQLFAICRQIDHDMLCVQNSRDFFQETLAARGLEEHVQISYPDFFENHQFHVIYCVNSRICTFFEEFLMGK
jgi:hypothetical protein